MCIVRFASIYFNAIHLQLVFRKCMIPKYFYFKKNVITNCLAIKLKLHIALHPTVSSFEPVFFFLSLIVKSVTHFNILKMHKNWVNICSEKFTRIFILFVYSEWTALLLLFFLLEFFYSTLFGMFDSLFNVESVFLLLINENK